jgi:hypothetical protein
MCVLKVYSDFESFKTFAESTKIPVYSIYEKGDYKNKSKKIIYTNYRISFDVSEKEWDNLVGQIDDAIVFLEKNFDYLQELITTHNISEAYLDFPLYSRLDDNIVNQNDHIPSKLISLAGKLSLGIEMSIYSRNAFDGLE